MISDGDAQEASAIELLPGRLVCEEALNMGLDRACCRTFVTCWGDKPA
jgi:hypothetical protein